MDPVHRLHELGQSVWLDFLDHGIIVNGGLERLIDKEGLSGVTSNPTIFQKAIAASTDYDELIQEAAPEESDESIFERIEIREVQLACDQLGAVYNDTAGADGFVSVEVSPRLAYYSKRSIEAARRLWAAIDRPNVMVKIPGTREGLPAIRQCLQAGININITLLFSVERYAEVAEAYISALEARAAQHKSLDRIASVASFFVSRVDTKVDKALDAWMDAHEGAAPVGHANLSGALEPAVAAVEKGQAAIANAKLAYAEYERVFATERWRRLMARGARKQRVLWASTSTKNPAYPDLHYADALVGPGTVDTMTQETLRAYADHGRPEIRLRSSVERSRAHLRQLEALDLDFRRMLVELEEEGVESFRASFDKAVSVIAHKRKNVGLSGNGRSPSPVTDETRRRARRRTATVANQDGGGPVRVELSLQEAKLLLTQVEARIAHLDNELVHTDRRDLQRALARDVDSLRSVADRIAAVTGAR